MVDGLADGFTAVVERVDVGLAVTAVDWAAYRKCPTCGVEIGAVCIARSGASW